MSHPKIKSGGALGKVFNFKFDFHEMKMINKIGKKWELESFFTRLLSLNRNKTDINIHKNHFDHVSDYLLDFMEKNCKHLSNIEENKYVFNIE